MGRSDLEDDTYLRPIMIKFRHIWDRNRVWKLRNQIPQTEYQQKVKIQADLPKALREDIPTLYKVVKAASTMEEYNTAAVRDFSVVLNGKHYLPKQLETLPFPLRPSSLASKRSEEACAFYSKSCKLLNHHPSPFMINDKPFMNIEHYLAFKRVELSQQQHVVDRALQAKDPIKAKSILNSLREDHVEEWKKSSMGITMEGLRQKFTQNEELGDFLLNTKDLQLGEASTDPCWGVGMTLDDQYILDTTKWKEDSNLLGKALMLIRTELRATPSPNKH